VANKQKLAKLRQFCRRKKLRFYPLSGVTGEGIDKLRYAMAECVDELRRKELTIKGAEEDEGKLAN
jgi:GTPase